MGRRSKSSKNSERLVYFLFVILLFGVFNSAQPQIPDNPTPTPTPTPTSNGGGGGGGGGTDPTPTPNPTTTLINSNIGRGSFGNAWTNGEPEMMVDLIANAGGDNIEMWSGDEQINYSAMFGWSTSAPGNPTYEQFLLRVAARAHERGLKLGLQWVIDEQTRRDIINNVNSKGDVYINVYKQIIQKFQPDFIDVLNEPIGDIPYTGYGTQSFLANYQNFVIRTIDELRSVSKLGNNLVCVVGAVPFWRLDSVISNPIPRSNVVYAVHAYYTWDNNYPASWELWNTAYWNAKTESDFVTAKALLRNDLINDIGIGRALAKGLTVFVEESGTYVYAPNAVRAMKDYWDICDEYGLDFNSQCSPWAYYIPQFDSNGELTPIGALWVQYLT